METVRDYQKSRVYKWERAVIKPRGGAYVLPKDAQGIVDFIWSSEGLLFPPKVKLNAKRAEDSGSANRHVLNLSSKGPTQTWVIIHELGHCMTHSRVQVGEDQNGHNEKFVGVYMKLVEKYLGINALILMHTAKQMNVDFDIGAKPYFLD